MPWTHQTFKTLGGVTLLDGRAARRRVRQQIVRSLDDRLGPYALAHNHGHFAIREDPRHLRRTAGQVRRLLRLASGIELQDPHIKPITEGSYEDNAARYILRQSGRHGLDEHPALCPGAVFPVLVDARRSEGRERETFFAWRPRWTRDDVFAVLGLQDPGQASPGMVARLPMDELDRMACEAFDVDLEGPRALRLAARRAACRLALDAGVRQADIARDLGFPRQRVQQLVHEPVPDVDLELVRRRVALELAVRQQQLRAGQRALTTYFAELGGKV